MKNQGNTTPPKENNHFLVTDPKEMEICDFPDKEFKIVILRKHNDLHKSTEKNSTKSLKTVHKQNEKLKERWK